MEFTEQNSKNKLKTTNVISSMKIMNLQILLNVRIFSNNSII